MGRIPALRPAAALAVVLALVPCGARAGSSTDGGGGTLSLSQGLNFTMAYPRFLRFRVGSAASGVIDTIVFTVPALSVGNATALVGAGGDAGGSTVNVEIVANFGQVTITPTNNGGGLGLGTGIAADGFISYSQIETLSNDASLPAPVLSDAGGTPSQPALSSTYVTTRTAQWTYRYLNATVPSAGTYGAGAGTGGRVTYTASMP